MPFEVILWFYATIPFLNFEKIHNLRTSRISRTQNGLFRKRMIIERRAIFYMIILIFGYLISWAPYAAQSLYKLFVSSSSRYFDTPLASLLPVLIAKSSTLWTSTFSKKMTKICPPTVNFAQN